MGVERTVCGHCRRRTRFKVKSDLNLPVNGVPELTLAIDTLTKAGRISNEPPNEVPESLSTTTPTTPPTSPATPSSTSLTSQGTASSTIPAPPEHEVPSGPALEAYLKPLLTTGITMTQLRMKLDHEKGKEWTAMLNNVATRIIELHNTHAAPRTIYGTMRTDFGTSWVTWSKPS